MILFKQIAINNDEATQTKNLNNAVVVWDTIRNPTIWDILYHLHLEEASSIIFFQRNNIRRDDGEI